MHLLKLKLLVMTALASVLILQGCGWHLRGAEPIPQELRTLHLQTASETSKFSRSLRRSFKAMGVSLTDTVTGAPYTLSVSGLRNDRRVLSTTGTGKVAEYNLTSTITYSMSDANGEKLVKPTTLSTEKAYLFNRDNAVSSFEEENLLREEMRRDLIQQLIRRYRAIKPDSSVTEAE